MRCRPLRGPSIRVRSPGSVPVVRDDVPPPDPSETFDVAGADPDPFDRFERWWAHTRIAVPGGDADAMVVATASAGGEPAARFVLLRGFDRRGCVVLSE